MKEMYDHRRSSVLPSPLRCPQLIMPPMHTSPRVAADNRALVNILLCLHCLLFSHHPAGGAPGCPSFGLPPDAAAADCTASAEVWGPAPENALIRALETRKPFASSRSNHARRSQAAALHRRGGTAARAAGRARLDLLGGRRHPHARRHSSRLASDMSESRRYVNEPAHFIAAARARRRRGWRGTS